MHRVIFVLPQLSPPIFWGKTNITLCMLSVSMILFVVYVHHVGNFFIFVFPKYVLPQICYHPALPSSAFISFSPLLLSFVPLVPTLLFVFLCLCPGTCLYYRSSSFPPFLLLFIECFSSSLYLKPRCSRSKRARAKTF